MRSERVCLLNVVGVKGGGGDEELKHGARRVKGRLKHNPGFVGGGGGVTRKEERNRPRTREFCCHWFLV